MRISDWSSDVCSSDLNTSEKMNEVELVLANNQTYKHKGKIEIIEGEFDKSTGNIAFRARFPNTELTLKNGSSGKIRITNELKNALIRSEERRVGKEWISKCRSRWSTYN